MAGFTYRYRLGGGSPTVERLHLRNGRRVSKGDMLNLEDGHVDLAVTGDDALLGVAVGATDGNGAGAAVDVITDPDAVYEVSNGFARLDEAFLDLTGPTGAQGVAEAANRDFTVVEPGAAERPLVRISAGRHAHDRMTGGELNAAMASAVVRIHREHLGRGPTKAQAFFRGNVVVVVMQDVMTAAEKSLVAHGQGDTVLMVRRQFQEAMREELVGAVQRLTGCRVTAFMSDNHIEPDLSTELFVLDRAVPAGRPAAR